MEGDEQIKRTNDIVRRHIFCNIQKNYKNKLASDYLVLKREYLHISLSYLRFV